MNALGIQFWTLAREAVGSNQDYFGSNYCISTVDSRQTLFRPGVERLCSVYSYLRKHVGYNSVASAFHIDILVEFGWNYLKIHHFITREICFVQTILEHPVLFILPEISRLNSQRAHTRHHYI